MQYTAVHHQSHNTGKSIGQRDDGSYVFRPNWLSRETCRGDVCTPCDEATSDPNTDGCAVYEAFHYGNWRWQNGGSVGKVFHFNKAQWQSVFGAVPDGTVDEVVQTRGGTEVWRGSVKTWDSDEVEEKGHGQRNTGSANNQWQKGDVISPTTGRPAIKKGLPASRGSGDDWAICPS